MFWVLSTLCHPPGEKPLDRVDLVMGGGLPGTTATQQQQTAGAAYQRYAMTEHALLDQLLLPGLLLQRLPLKEPDAATMTVVVVVPTASCLQGPLAALPPRPRLVLGALW